MDSLIYLLTSLKIFNVSDSYQQHLHINVSVERNGTFSFFAVWSSFSLPYASYCICSHEYWFVLLQELIEAPTAASLNHNYINDWQRGIPSGNQRYHSTPSAKIYQGNYLFRKQNYRSWNLFSFWKYKILIKLWLYFPVHSRPDVIYVPTPQSNSEIQNSGPSFYYDYDNGYDYSQPIQHQQQFDSAFDYEYQQQQQQQQQQQRRHPQKSPVLVQYTDAIPSPQQIQRSANIGAFEQQQPRNQQEIVAKRYVQQRLPDPGKVRLRRGMFTPGVR